MVFLAVKTFFVDVDFSPMLFTLQKCVLVTFKLLFQFEPNVLPMFFSWQTTGPMITEKHDKHMSESFMWILPNLLYEALCIGTKSQVWS